MKLREIKLFESGFSTKTKGLYILNKGCAVHFAPNDPEATLPKETDLGRWEFYDEDGSFEQVVPGSFKAAVKKATDIHKNLKGSSFSTSLKVRKVR
jgi:hypothetical protein